MRNSYIAIYTKTKRGVNKRKELHFFSKSVILSYEEIAAHLITSYKPTDKIRVEVFDSNNISIAIREDHPLFNICLLYEKVLENRAVDNAFGVKVSPIISDILTRLINSYEQQK
jgi:hypothetical protein